MKATAKKKTRLPSIPAGERYSSERVVKAAEKVFGRVEYRRVDKS